MESSQPVIINLCDEDGVGEPGSQDSSWDGPQTIPCLRDERRKAEAQRARAVLELDDVKLAEQRYDKKQRELHAWRERLAAKEAKLRFRLKMAEATLKLVDEFDFSKS